MECHRCPNAEDVRLGKYRDTPFEQTPCSTCELRESSAHTLDADPNRIEQPPAVPTAEEPRLPLSVLTRAMQDFLALPAPVVEIIRQRSAGRSLKAIGRRQGLSPTAVDARLRRAVRKVPHLQAMLLRRSE